MSQSAEVSTTYQPAWSPNMPECDITPPVPADTADSLTYKEFYATSGWQRGLTTSEEFWVNGSRRKWTTFSWKHAGADADLYPTNPRVEDTTVSDAEGNPRRTSVAYETFTPQTGGSYRLPREVTEYAADATTPLRTTLTEYDLPNRAQYEALRILGLPLFRKVYDGTSSGTLMSEVDYSYDDTGNVGGDPNLPAYLQALPSPAWQHDAANYGAAFAVRGNLTRVQRHDVTGGANSFVEAQAGYNVTGAVAFARDEAGHLTGFGYADAFQPDVNRTDQNPQNRLKTFAYPTTVTDPDGFTHQTWYNYDMGAVTQGQTPQPEGATQPPVAKSYYDGAGRVIKTLSVTNGAYTQLAYDASMEMVRTYRLLDPGLVSYSTQVLDGAGRVRAAARDLPGSVGDYSGQLTDYDSLGRVARQSNPTETDAAGASWAPKGDDDPNAPNPGRGWVYTQQTYDWKGRPLVTTNTDATQKSASYDGCGCAGGEVVTLTDEVGRRRKVYSDALGRRWKTEVYDWNGNVYSTTESILNARDQATFVRQFQGTDQSGVFQETANTYDGYGRLQSSHAPDQDAGHSTTYSYNADDTLASVTDARGAVTTYSYMDQRGLLTGVTHALSGSDPLSVTYAYDAAGNRTSMTTGGGAGGSVAYHYDSFSRLTSEDRQFPGLSGAYTLSYDYTLAGQLKSVTDQAGGTSFTYTIDAAGRLTQVDSTGFGAGAPLASDMQYRAWGALKHSDFGNGTGVSFGYDGRGMVSSYSLSGVKDLSTSAVRPEGSDVKRYADGLVKFASDYQSDAQGSGIQDRAYQYDHAGRLLEAYSGTDARNILSGVNSNVGDGPFRQSYAYDEWDNQKSRTGRYWSQDDNDSETYTPQTGRNQAWSYDADGRLVSRNEPSPNDLTYVPARYSFDAAGRRAQMTQTTSRPNPNPRVSTIITTAVTQADIYDGDGLGVKRAVTKQVNGGAPTTAATYYLRSSVLGGRIVAEYNSSGARQSSNIWAGGEVLAEQTGVDIGMPQLKWEHLNPATGDGREMDSAGRAVKATHLDPSGVDVGESDPFAGAAGDPSADTGDSAVEGRIAQLMSGYFDMKCSIDGMLTGCAVAGSAVASGAAVECPDNDCGPRSVSVILTYESGKQKTFTGLTDPFSAYADDKSGFGYYAGDGVSDDGHKMLMQDGFGLHLYGQQAQQAAQSFTRGMAFGGFGAGLFNVINYNNYLEQVSGSQDSRKKYGDPIPHPHGPYSDCLNQAFGRSTDAAPSEEAALAILKVAATENIAPTLLAVTWAGESGFTFNPDSNPNDGTEGNADIGPVQINYRTWHDSSLLNGLVNVFGTTTTGSESFNGDPIANLQMGARILNSYGSGRTAAGLYRTGRGSFAKTKRGKSEFNRRAGLYDQLAPTYNAFFDCLKNSL